MSRGKRESRKLTEHEKQLIISGKYTRQQLADMFNMGYTSLYRFIINLKNEGYSVSLVSGKSEGQRKRKREATGPRISSAATVKRDTVKKDATPGARSGKKSNAVLPVNNKSDFLRPLTRDRLMGRR